MTTGSSEQELRLSAEQCMKDGNNLQALDCYKQLCRLDPENVQNWHIRGALSGMLGDFTDTVFCCEKALVLAPDESAIYANYARALTELGRNNESINAFSQALSLNPNDVASQINMGKLYKNTGKFHDAISCFQAALDIAPDSAEAMDETGQAYFASGNYNDALVWYKYSVEKHPESAVYQNNLGTAYLQLGDFQKAKKHFQKSIHANPALLTAYCNLAYLYSTQGNYDEAINHYDQALKQSSRYEPALAGKGAILERQGRYEAAYKLVKPTITSGAWSTLSALTYARLCPQFGYEQEAIEILEQVLDDAVTSHDYRTQAEFLLGKLLDLTGKHADAFAHIEIANKLCAKAFDRKLHQQLTDSIITAFSHENAKHFPVSSNADAGMIFIIGMPRSGTTLVEQILATHPEAYGAGELTDIQDLAVKLSADHGYFLPSPAKFERISNEMFDTLSHAHTEKMHGLANRENIILDKMPSNFMFLGLIQHLIPKAKIIHCVRSPMDTCLSCYFQHFQSGQDFACNLSDLAFYYNTYLKLMKHWNSSLQLPILEVKYEELVTNQESGTRQLLEFAGLDWDSGCLDFHKSNRIVTTASYEQVRNPVYTSSVGKWKRYRKQLITLVQELECKIS